MKTGMLWYDNSGLTLEERLEKAAEYYNKKYGVMPNLAFVPVGILAAGARDQVGAITLEGNRSVLPHHIWLGVAA